jgi:hypothetical protein
VSFVMKWRNADPLWPLPQMDKRLFEQGKWAPGLPQASRALCPYSVFSVLSGVNLLAASTWAGSGGGWPW